MTTAAENEASNGAWLENTVENGVIDRLGRSRGRGVVGAKASDNESYTARLYSSVASAATWEARREGVRREKETGRALGLCTSNFPSAHDLALGKDFLF